MALTRREQQILAEIERQLESDGSTKHESTKQRSAGSSAGRLRIARSLGWRLRYHRLTGPVLVALGTVIMLSLLTTSTFASFAGFVLVVIGFGLMPLRRWMTSLKHRIDSMFGHVPPGS